MIGPVVVRRYEPGHRPLWDEFVNQSRNGTFILTRAYVEYHSDRFEDASILFFGDRDRLIGVLPANLERGTIVSHRGLTYGGIVVPPGGTLRMVLLMMEALMQHAELNDISTIIYKPIPSIYHRAPCEEDRLALYINGARVAQREILSVVPREGRLSFQARRLRAARKAADQGVQIQETLDLASFWKVLEERLAERHSATPVHTLAEIQLLQRRFPNQIRLFEARLDAEVVAGAVVYDTHRVARVQYMAASETGRSTGALDLVLVFLLNDAFKDKPYVDLGSSHVPQSGLINQGLVDYKEGFGARAIAHDVYEVHVDG